MNPNEHYEDWQEEELAWHGQPAHGKLNTWQNRWILKGVTA